MLESIRECLEGDALGAGMEGTELAIEHIIVIMVTMVLVIIIIMVLVIIITMVLVIITMVSVIITMVSVIIIITMVLGITVMFGIFDQEGTDMLADGHFGLCFFKGGGLQMLHPPSLL